jgi:hypothetical protein
MPHERDLIDADVPPARAAMIAARAQNEYGVKHGLVAVDEKTEDHMEFVRFRTDEFMSHAIEYLIMHHGFALTPRQPDNGIEVYAELR